MFSPSSADDELERVSRFGRHRQPCRVPRWNFAGSGAANSKVH